MIEQRIPRPGGRQSRPAGHSIGLTILALISCAPSAHAQPPASGKLTLKGVPSALQVEFTPKDFQIIDGAALRMTTAGGTDIFVSPHDSYARDNGPRALFKADPEFIFSAKVKCDFKTKYDNASLVVYESPQHWIKLAYQSNYYSKPSLVTIVTNQHSDDAQGFYLEGDFVYLKIHGHGQSFWLYYSLDGKSWVPIRAFRLYHDGNLRVGFLVASPAGPGCTGEFSDIKYTPTSPKDLWQGQ